MGAEPEDQRLVEAVRRGDPQAWSVLLQRHQNRLYATCLRMVGDPETAADLTQDTMVKIIQGLDSYDGRSRLSTWMFRIAMNACLSHLRSQKLRRHASLDRPENSGTGGRSGGDLGAGGEALGREQSRELPPDSGVQESEGRRRVARALATLGVEQRAILVLRDVQGLEYEQIAATLDLNVGTVKSRLFRARVALREAIEAMEDRQRQ